MNTRGTFYLLLRASLILGMSPLDWAANPNDPCILDEANLCGTVRPGNGKVLACMIGHAESLSPACHKSIMKVNDHVRDVRAACAADIQRFCANIPPVTVERIRCLKQWTDQVTPGCQESIQRLKALPHQPDY